jgi:hypothetical protein
VRSASEIQLVKNLSIAGDQDEITATLAMDEHNIAVFLEMPQFTKIEFFSTETLTIVNSRTVASTEGRILLYHRGLLITQKENDI